MRSRFTATVLALASAFAAAGQTARSPKPYSRCRECPTATPIYRVPTISPRSRRSSGPAGMKAVLTPEEAAKFEKLVASQKDKSNRGHQRRSFRAAQRWRWVDRSGWWSRWLQHVLARSRLALHRRRWTDSVFARRRSARWPRAALQRAARGSGSGGCGRGRHPTRRKAGIPGLEAAGSYDDPERRPLGERCLLGFGSTSGPPALPDYFYNNLHQIVQTPDSVMILTEMVHDARIVRMNAQHLPKTIRRWMGDSVGHWEGDTLVVDTTNFNDKTRFRGSTENLHVVERFTRVDARTLLYRFTVDDPETWDGPGPGNTPGRRPANPFTNTPATRPITRWATSCAARGCERRKQRQRPNRRDDDANQWIASAALLIGRRAASRRAPRIWRRVRSRPPDPSQGQSRQGGVGQSSHLDSRRNHEAGRRERSLDD